MLTIIIDLDCQEWCHKSRSINNLDPMLRILPDPFHQCCRYISKSVQASVHVRLTHGVTHSVQHTHWPTCSHRTCHNGLGVAWDQDLCQEVNAPPDLKGFFFFFFFCRLPSIFGQEPQWRLNDLFFPRSLLFPEHRKMMKVESFVISFLSFQIKKPLQMFFQRRLLIVTNSVYQ